MIKIICNSRQYTQLAEDVAKKINVTVQFDVDQKSLQKSTLALVFNECGVNLLSVDEQKTGAVYVDLLHGKLGYRLRHNEAKPLIAKAVGIKPGITPTVWDMTAGLGQDSLILAKLGCRVQMHERNPIVYCLLADGLERAKLAAEDSEDIFLREVMERLTLFSGDARNALKAIMNEKPNVVYLDPMFPDRKKSAKVKKGMQLFHHVVGNDTDADELLDLALSTAQSRVVVKRPKGAPVLAGQEPPLQFHGKTLRFDVYPLKKIENQR